MPLRTVFLVSVAVAVAAASGSAGVLVDGGAGDDSVDGGTGNDTVSGGAGNDTVAGGDGDDSVDGGDGDDSITGGDGNDTIGGVVGADVIDAGAGNDSVNAGSENDTVAGGTGADSMDGGDGIDTLDYSTSAQPVEVDLEAQTVTGGDGTGDEFINFEGVIGSDGNDTITGNDGPNTIDGGGGDDTVDGGDGNDSIDGGDGDDTVDGGDGDDTIDGGDGDDSIDGGDGDDTIDGGNGDDTMGGGGGDDVFNVGPATGNDSILGGETGETIGDTIIITAGPGDQVIVTPDDNDPEMDAGTIVVIDTNGNTISNITYDEIENVQIVCFTRGTMIMTPKGEVAIEDLEEGDMVVTRDHGVQPIRWIGSQKVEAAGKLAPVMIREGALGNDRDLKVSPLHRMLITDWRAELMFDEAEVLAAAKHLVNGDTIYVEEGGEVEYFHMLFDQHEIVTANGAPSESFHPGEQGLSWLEEEVREEIFAIFPELRIEVEGYGPAARTSLKGWEARALKR
ncbi:MAG: Hint domain-containing protein [Pseudomonadota bacterium]